MSEKNPFQFEAANNLTDEMIADYFVGDFNYSRFIKSKRNIFLVGERGCGKTMVLLYNSWRIQKLIGCRSGTETSKAVVGVYVPCNVLLTQRPEYQFLDKFQGSILSEHFLALSIAHAVIETISEIDDVEEELNTDAVRREIQFLLSAELPEDMPILTGIRQFLEKELLLTQRAINKSLNAQVFYENSFSFATVVLPILKVLRSINLLSETHFLLLMDDANYLNKNQLKILNSWIAYRDHSIFSFKVAITEIGIVTRLTTSGGSILEGHDYTRIDLEESYQNRDSDFYKLAKQIIEKRLEDSNISKKAEEFFPINTKMSEDLVLSEEAVRREAIEKYGESNKKPVRDYIYKYRRVHYFRSRPDRANRPPYSGFEILVYLSTGVVRDLLEPCFWMFDKILSSQGENGIPITQIPPKIQTELILKHSERLWEELEKGLDQIVEHCSPQDGKNAFNLLNTLGDFFRERLLKHESEPRALSFTISGTADEQAKLKHLIEILRRARFLYVKSGPAKDRGRRETYYVPNRMLWPARGLDPQGQHARVSIQALVLWDAAYNGNRIPFKLNDATDDRQVGLNV